MVNFYEFYILFFGRSQWESRANENKKAVCLSFQLLFFRHVMNLGQLTLNWQSFCGDEVALSEIFVIYPTTFSIKQIPLSVNQSPTLR
jgi:hypothetical protein